MDPTDRNSARFPDASIGERAAIGRVEQALFGGPDRLTQLGRYQILDKIGSGAFGQVYRAFDPRLDRTVAVKVLAGNDTTGDAPVQQHLIGEAKAMANVTHPNVAAVYDAGIVGEGHRSQVFIAMELVDGGDLRQWLASRSRTLSQVIDVLRQAGRGLAAAHEAGVVHRDFKPDNVLVGRDGRVRVADFGLARPMVDSGAPLPAVSGPIDVGLRTATGALVGTPAYMAPEQFDGHPGDALSDEFAYCVTFWEALYGCRPFAGRTVPELLDNALRGRTNRGPRQRRVPAKLEQIVLRGLSGSPDQRYPSIDALLKALDEIPSRRRAWTVAAVLGTVAAGTTSALALWPQAPCQNAEARWDAVWNSSRSVRIQEAFAATGREYAPLSSLAVIAALDRYGEGWVAQHSAACRATHIEHEQSSALLDQRMECLRRRLDDVDAIATVFESADIPTVDNAAVAVRQLPPISRCSTQAMREHDAALPPPGAPNRAEVQALYQSITVADTLNRAGKPDQALAQLQSLETAVQSQNFGPLTAMLLASKAEALMAGGDHLRAAEVARQAFDEALRSSHDQEAVLAAIVLSSATSHDPSQRDEALRWVRTGESLLQRLPDGSDTERMIARASLANSEGNVHLATGQPQLAYAAFLRGLESLRSVDADHPSIGTFLANLALAEIQQARFESAGALLREALTHTQTTLGPGHPSAADILVNLSVVANSTGAFGEAAEVLTRALHIQQTTLGSDHPALVYTQLNLAIAQQQLGDTTSAETYYAAAEALATKKLGATHPLTAQIQVNYSDLLAHDNRIPEARKRANTALSSLSEKMGDQHPSVMMGHSAVALVERKGGNWMAALEHANAGVALGESNLGLDHPQTLMLRQQKANALIAGGRDDEALVILRAIEHATSTTVPDITQLARARFAIARVVIHTDRHAALVLARQAQLAGPAAGAQLREAIDTWIALNKDVDGTLGR